MTRSMGIEAMLLSSCLAISKQSSGSCGSSTASTKGRFQPTKITDCFPAMNSKRWSSCRDPKQTIEFLLLQR